MDALDRALLRGRGLASAGVVVDAKDAAALAFYKKVWVPQTSKGRTAALPPNGHC
jgi:hypothetical protein